jgi:hypothetical protein
VRFAAGRGLGRALAARTGPILRALRRMPGVRVIGWLSVSDFCLRCRHHRRRPLGPVT